MKTGMVTLMTAVAILSSSCAEDPDPLSIVSVPQIVSTKATAGVYSAVLEATITSSGNFTGSGFVVEDSSSETRTVNASVDGNLMKLEVSGLNPVTEYSFKAFVSNGKAVLYSREESFITGFPDPEASFSIVTVPYSRSALLTATVNPKWGEVSLVRFLIGESGSSIPDMTVLETVLEDGTYSALAHNLIPGKEYDVRAVAVFPSSEVTSEVVSFRTEEEASFGEISFTSDGNSAQAKAIVLNYGLVSECGFLFGKTGSAQTEYKCSLENGMFSYDFPSLEWETEYSLTAFLETPDGRKTSDIYKVTTPSEPIVPVTVTVPTAEVGTDWAIMTSTVDPYEGVSGCGFVISSNGGRTVEYSGTLTGNTFSVRASSLSPGTNYTCYAFCHTRSGRTVSTSMTFTTLEDTSLRITDLSVKADVNSVSLSAGYSGVGEITGTGFVLGNDSVGMKEYKASNVSDGVFSAEIGDLAPDTQYRVYAFIDTSDGRITSVQSTFRTKEVPVGGISFTELSASLSGNSVMLAAEISSGEGVTECGFGLSLNGKDYTEYGATMDGLSLTRTIGNLQSGKTYYYYAFVMVGSSRIQSETLSFTTE